MRAVAALDARVFHVRVACCDVLQQVSRALGDLRTELAGGVVQPAVPVLVVTMVDVFALRAEGDIAGTAPERVLALVDGNGVLAKLDGGPEANIFLADFALKWSLVGVIADHVSSKG